MQSLVQPEDPAGGWQGLVGLRRLPLRSQTLQDIVQTAVWCHLMAAILHVRVGHRVRQALHQSCSQISAEPNVPACDAVHACRLTFMQLLRNGPSGCPADAAGDDSDGSEGFLETLQREVTQERVPAGGNAEGSKSEKEDLTCRWGLVDAHECSCCAPAFLQHPVKK